jgi:hypothetical protein
MMGMTILFIIWMYNFFPMNGTKMVKCDMRGSRCGPYIGIQMVSLNEFNVEKEVYIACGVRGGNCGQSIIPKVVSYVLMIHLFKGGIKMVLLYKGERVGKIQCFTHPLSPKEGPKGSPKEGPKEGPKESPKGSPKEGPKEGPKESPKESMMMKNKAPIAFFLEEE